MNSDINNTGKNEHDKIIDEMHQANLDLVHFLFEQKSISDIKSNLLEMLRLIYVSNDTSKDEAVIEPVIAEYEKAMFIISKTQDYLYMKVKHIKDIACKRKIKSYSISNKDVVCYLLAKADWELKLKNKVDETVLENDCPKILFDNFCGISSTRKILYKQDEHNNINFLTDSEYNKVKEKGYTYSYENSIPFIVYQTINLI